MFEHGLLGFERVEGPSVRVFAVAIEFVRAIHRAFIVFKPRRKSSQLGGLSRDGLRDRRVLPLRLLVGADQLLDPRHLGLEHGLGQLG